MRWVSGLLGFCVLFFALSASASTPERPQIPPVFSSDFEFYMNINDGVPFDLMGTYQVDAFAENMRWFARSSLR